MPMHDADAGADLLGVHFCDDLFLFLGFTVTLQDGHERVEVRSLGRDLLVVIGVFLRRESGEWWSARACLFHARYPNASERGVRGWDWGIMSWTGGFLRVGNTCCLSLVSPC